MKLFRVFQPRNPLFWLMLALNALSAALAWIVQNRPFNTVAMIVVAVFALCNARIAAEGSRIRSESRCRPHKSRLV